MILSELTKKCLILLFSVLIICSYQFPRIIANRGEETYENPEVKVATLESDIVSGAGYFLRGYGDYLQLLNRVELAEQEGIDYTELAALVSRAIDTMEKARASYISLYQWAAATPYNADMINKLITFDYKKFGDESRLIKSIFADTTAYLGKGDVTGLFGKLLIGTNQVLTRLYAVKAAVDGQVFPDLSNLWRLNQDFSYHLMFGQYAAEVFYAITQ